MEREVIIMLELLIFGALLGGSAIKCGIQNARMMSKPYRHLEDGTPVYLDRLCNEHINGEKVTVHYDFSGKQMNTQLVGTQSGRIYHDSHQSYLNRVDRENEEKRQKALSEGKLAYIKLFPTNTIPGNISNSITDCRFTCDCNSGRVIGKLEREKDGTCYKYYMTSLKNPNSDCVFNENVEKIQISEEEFNRLNIIGGKHFVLDLTKERRY
jgi:hypothetical protein